MFWLKLACVYVITTLVDLLPLDPFTGIVQTKDCYELLVVCEFLYPNAPERRHQCIQDCVVSAQWQAAEADADTTDQPDSNAVIDEDDLMYKNETYDGKKIFEGDMVLSKTQTDMYKRARKARANLNYWWPNGVIPYSIAHDAEVNRRPILIALQHWMEQTCLKFKPVALHAQFPHIIFRRLQGCYSSVGREALENPTGQDLSIGPGCEEVGTIIHEVGHGIGFFHEHARRDRETYVKIMYANSKPHLVSNFRIANTKDFNIPYDLKSIMHYKSREFSSNGKNTIVPIDPMRHFEIGQRKKLSFLDIKLANVMYKCNAHCSNSIVCQNDGFIDKHCRCRCPEEWTGQHCESYLGKLPVKCGGEIRKSTTISSPNYPYSYPKDSQCIWHVLSPKNMRIRIQFTDFDVRPRTDMNSLCKKDNVEIRVNNKHNGETYCGKDVYGQSFTSREHEMYIFFGSKNGGYKGFQAKIQFIGGG